MNAGWEDGIPRLVPVIVVTGTGRAWEVDTDRSPLVGCNE